MTDTLLYILLALAAADLLLTVLLLVRLSKKEESPELEIMLHAEKDIEQQLRDFRAESAETTGRAFQQMAQILSTTQKSGQEAVAAQLGQIEGRLKTSALESEQKLDNIRTAVEKRLTYLQTDNNVKLDEMRKIVEEKLDDKMNKSFQLVNDRLEQVYKGLGEMQTLATGVGDLKKVLSNVKTRGILGEVQLGAILEEILSPEQYETNVATKHGSANRVEYAIRLPSDDDSVVYLPIDSKFPGDAYSNYRDAYENGTPEETELALATLLGRIKQFAKDIRDKYIDPPYTTEFGLMFLPFEGLYAEAVNRGMVELLQREYRINIAGPSTMAALLNSLQMGFRSVAIQKRSSEVWKVLGGVKTEFDKFAGVLETTQQRLEQANDELDKLVGVRTRQIQKRLRSVATLGETDITAALPAAEERE